MSLFHFQKNFAESSYCFCVAITFLHQPSTLTCRHVLNFAAVKRARPSPTPHHASPKSALAVSPPFLFSALVYSSFKMEGDSAVRGYHDTQINRFESQLSEINLLHKESFVINLSVLNGKVQPHKYSRITCNFFASGGRAIRLLLKFITGRRRHCKQLCGGMEILCCVTFSCSRKAAIKCLKDLLTTASIH